MKIVTFAFESGHTLFI